MNADDRFAFQRHLIEFERRMFEVVNDLDESDVTIALVGIILRPSEMGERKPLDVLDAMLRPTQPLSDLLLSGDRRHPLAIALPPLTETPERPGSEYVSSSSDDCAEIAPALESWWNQTADDELASEWSQLAWESRERWAGGETQRSLSGWSSLTDAELRVVELVSLGLTNRQVGQQMFLSRHTIDSHLRHIFDKLGIRSRVQLARLAFAEFGASG